ncbi:MAG TPA: hypothetical protein VGT41_03215 [Candidatus Babeliales bacterium]|nr:hypothetical protein [Candidatus Babeliales bacterium]
MNKRFLLATFAIIAITVSNNLTPINPDCEKRLLENERQQLQAAHKTLKEATAEASALQTALSSAMAKNLPETAALLEKLVTVDAKVEAAQDTCKRIITQSPHDQFKKEKELFRAADEAENQAYSELEAAQNEAAKSANIKKSEIEALHKKIEDAHAKWLSALKADREIRNNLPSSLEQYFKIEEPSSKSTTTDDAISYAKAIVTNSWVKRIACTLVACGICTFVYNRYNQAHESNEERSDNE